MNEGIRVADDIRAVVLVEGLSDRSAVEALALRRGRDFAAEGVSVIPIGGAQAIRRALALYGPTGLDLALAGLCDAGEERSFRRLYSPITFATLLRPRPFRRELRPLDRRAMSAPPLVRQNRSGFPGNTGGSGAGPSGRPWPPEPPSPPSRRTLLARFSILIGSPGRSSRASAVAYSSPPRAARCRPLSATRW